MSGENDNPPTTTQPATGDRETRQFGIRGLMWFTLLAALWCPQPIIFKEFWQAPQGVSLTGNHINVATVFFAWAVLLAASYRQRFYGIFACHLLLPILGTVYVVWQYGSRNLGHGLVLFVLAMNLACFPGTVLAMVFRWLRRQPAAKTDERPRQQRPH
jgi:hypothetical protein